MAAPNIAALTTITGKTAVANVATSNTTILSNSAASNKVFKVNTLIVSNINGTASADISVGLVRSSVEYKVAHTISVPADSSLVVITKDNGIYLEEGDTLQALANTVSYLQVVCSYEDIS